jgi:hypothetical protein
MVIGGEKVESGSGGRSGGSGSIEGNGSGARTGGNGNSPTNNPSNNPSNIQLTDPMKDFPEFRSVWKRPDDDRYLTLDEANEWYRKGKGLRLTVDLSKIDLSVIYASDFSYIGEKKVFDLEQLGSKDGRVYGSITLVLKDENTVASYWDEYNFEMHDTGYNPFIFARNLFTLFGGAYAGDGIPYDIAITGSAKIAKNRPKRLPNR